MFPHRFFPPFFWDLGSKGEKYGINNSEALRPYGIARFFHAVFVGISPRYADGSRDHRHNFDLAR